MLDARSSEFLVELFNQTEGDTERQVSMHDVGAALGLDKNEGGSLAEDLIMDELVELKTLAGGIGLTSKGFEALQQMGMVQVSAGDVLRFSGKPVLEKEDRSIIKQVTEEIQGGISRVNADYQLVEQVVIDLKTIDVQLLSSSPKTDIILAVLRSVQESMKKLGADDIALKLDGLLA